jgi:DNA protecting protein DprA
MTGVPPAPPPSGEQDLPDVAYAVALAGLGDMTPARLRVLLDARPARDVYEHVRNGDPALVERLAQLGGAGRSGSPEPPLDMEVSWGASGSLGAMERARAQARHFLQSWRVEADHTPIARPWQDLQARGIGVVRRGDVAYPARLLRARQVPELLYVRGRLDQASAPCVGIVGTRRATHYGLEVALELGRDLAERGVVVVSGLARGIDAAAHRGVLAARERVNGPLAVVGGGVDIVYPRENRQLWEQVLATGTVISEAPPGAPPESWRFPLRNRIIAALSQVLVVVESSRQGGAIHTVLAADAYGVPILAVPGSVRSPQSEGTNAIIQEGGAGVVLDVHDVLALLSMVCEDDGTTYTWTGQRPAGDLRKPVSGSWRFPGRRPDGVRSTNTGPARDPGTAVATGPAAGDHSTQQAMDLVLAASVDAAPMTGDQRSHGGSTGSIADCTPAERAVLNAVDYTATLMELVCLRTTFDLGIVALAIDRLEELGLVRSEGAAWIRT